MRLSHACGACGFELTRTPALVEPHYGLPMVRCTRCGVRCVRRRHPLSVAARRACVVVRAAAALARSVVILTAITFLPILMVTVTVDLFDREEVTPLQYLGWLLSGRSGYNEAFIELDRIQAWLVFVLAPPTGMMCGVLAVGGLWWWRLSAACAACLLLMPATIVLFGTLAWVQASLLLPETARDSFVDGWDWISGQVLTMWNVGYLTIFLMSAGMCAGCIMGTRVRRARPARLSRRWRKTLARARRKRSAA